MGIKIKKKYKRKFPNQFLLTNRDATWMKPVI